MYSPHIQGFSRLVVTFSNAPQSQVSLGTYPVLALLYNSSLRLSTPHLRKVATSPHLLVYGLGYRA
jgi:hypothetical protein